MEQSARRAATSFGISGPTLGRAWVTRSRVCATASRERRSAAAQSETGSCLGRFGQPHRQPPRFPRVAGRSSLLTRYPRPSESRSHDGSVTGSIPVRFIIAAGLPHRSRDRPSKRFLIGHRQSGLSLRVRSEPSPMAIGDRHGASGRPCLLYTSRCAGREQAARAVRSRGPLAR